VNLDHGALRGYGDTRRRPGRPAPRPSTGLSPSTPISDYPISDYPISDYPISDYRTPGYPISGYPISDYRISDNPKSGDLVWRGRVMGHGVGDAVILPACP
jgi:hypothetical protein